MWISQLYTIYTLSTTRLAYYLYICNTLGMKHWIIKQENGRLQFTDWQKADIHD